MTIAEFAEKYKPCQAGLAWAKKNCPSGTMAEAWDKLCQAEPGTDEADFFDWVWTRAFDDRTLRKIAVRMVRETPLADGRKVADLLTDPRSLAALEVAERYADGLAAAWAAARVALKQIALSYGNPFEEAQK